MKHSPSLFFGIVMVLVCAAIFLFGTGARNPAQANQGSSSLPHWVMKIPLWKVLPTKKFVVLGEGVLKRRRWAIFAFANTQAGASQRPCIENVTLRYEHGIVSTSSGAPSCGGLAPPKSVPVTTEFVFTNVAGLIVGMTLDPSVARVLLNFSSGTDLNVPTRLLSTRQAKKAQVKRFRYVAMGIGRKACLEAFRGMANNGEILFQTPPQECILAP